MSSWFARSLANSLRIDDDDDDIQNDVVTESPTTSPRNNNNNNNNANESEENDDETLLQGRGVKEDLDEIKQPLTRQFWGMASFLAPPPSTISHSNTFGSAVGITEEVLTFAMNIAMHPETWLDFPIDEEDDNDGNLYLIYYSFLSCRDSILIKFYSRF